VHQADGPAE